MNKSLIAAGNRAHDGTQLSPTYPPLLEALRQPRCYPHAVDCIQIIETHISWVVLTGRYAYKIKKPVDLQFADFRSLSARLRYCQEEVRLNRRLAADLYLHTVAITGSESSPTIGGRGDAIEYAVCMRQFPQAALLTARLAGGGLNAETLRTLGHIIAAFHATAARVNATSGVDASSTTLRPALDNFSQMLHLLNSQEQVSILEALHDWTLREFDRVEPLVSKRIAAGWTRECHGDLHLGNIAIIDDNPVPFDCLEFAPPLRQIDVINEAAFLVMDLEAQNRCDLAFAFLNAYLDDSGDYEGVALLPFFRVYRALVRAKITLIKANELRVRHQPHEMELDLYSQYMLLAERYTTVSRGAIFLMHGVSGCGKTAVSAALLEQCGAVRVRSDLERKRVNAVAPLGRTESPPYMGIYSADITELTYQRLLQLAHVIANSGIPVIVDATFLKKAYRTLFFNLAQKLRVPFHIISIFGAPEILRRRVAARLCLGNDASEARLATLDAQLGSYEPLTDDELAFVISVDAANDPLVNAGTIYAQLLLRVPQVSCNLLKLSSEEQSDSHRVIKGT